MGLELDEELHSRKYVCRRGRSLDLQVLMVCSLCEKRLYLQAVSAGSSYVNVCSGLWTEVGPRVSFDS